MIPNPTPDAILEPGDLLVLMGDVEGIEAARALTRACADTDPTLE